MGYNLCMITGLLQTTLCVQLSGQIHYYARHYCPRYRYVIYKGNPRTAYGVGGYPNCPYGSHYICIAKI